MRKEFSRKIRKFIIERACGKCEQCGAVLKTGEGDIDHIIPDALGGNPDADNGQLLCRVCHKEKTLSDIKRISKSNRQRDKAIGAFKRKNTFNRIVKAKKTAVSLPKRNGGVFKQYGLDEVENVK